MKTDYPSPRTLNMTTPAHDSSSRLARLTHCSRLRPRGAGAGWRSRILVLIAGLFAAHVSVAETVLEDIRYSSLAGHNYLLYLAAMPSRVALSTKVNQGVVE